MPAFSRDGLTGNVQITDLGDPNTYVTNNLCIRLQNGSRLPPPTNIATDQCLLRGLDFGTARGLTRTGVRTGLSRLINSIRDRSVQRSVLCTKAMIPSRLGRLLSLLERIDVTPLVATRSLGRVDTVIRCSLRRLGGGPSSLLPRLTRKPTFCSSFTSSRSSARFMSFGSVLKIGRSLSAGVGSDTYIVSC